jgi:hypothetical protein
MKPIDGGEVSPVAGFISPPSTVGASFVQWHDQYSWRKLLVDMTFGQFNATDQPG